MFVRNLNGIITLIHIIVVKEVTRKLQANYKLSVRNLFFLQVIFLKKSTLI